MNNCILDEWKINYKKVPPSFEEFCTDIKVYKLKYSWQRFIPRFILHRLIKPTTFKNCYPTCFSNLDFGKGDDVVTQSITMNYEEFEGEDK
jgi:hypothetical protein